MIRDKSFWVGVLAGVVLFYLYQNHLKGMGGSK